MKKNRFDLIPYNIRFKASLISVLIVVILCFKYGPELGRTDLHFNNYYQNNQITIDLIEITTQSSPPSAPPKPRVPVRTLTDPVVSDTDIDVVFDIPVQFDAGIDLTVGQNIGIVVRNPQRPPRVQRIVEPISPDKSSRIEIIAELTIGIDGRVEDVQFITFRRLNLETGRMEIVDAAEEPYLQATREAAFQWLFRPATEQGLPVRSVSEHVFTFGRGIN